MGRVCILLNMGKVTLLFVVGIVLLFFPHPTFAYYTNMPASVVVGQSSFSGSSANQSGSTAANTLSGAYGVYSNGSNFIVGDPGNHRVLIFNSIPTSNNASANVVIGQTNFSNNTANQGGSTDANTLSTPRGMCSNGQKLIVVDNANNRVLVYNQIPTTNNASADVVIGQANFSGNSENQAGSIGSNTLKAPRGAFCFGNKLLISDTNNNRILIFNQIPTSHNASADLVLGQPDFTTGTSDFGGISVNGAKVLEQPGGVWTDGTRLLVADQGNNRILVFNSFPTENFAEADYVIGQVDKTSSAINQGGSANGNTLRGVRSVFSDGKRIFASDFSNHRILVFNSFPSQHNAGADLVLGQQDFVSVTANQGGGASATTLNGPSNDSLYIIGDKLLVTEFNNSRALIYENITSTPVFALSSPESQPEGKVRLRGAVTLGERGTYALQRIQANVNGEGFSNVTYKSGGTSDGAGITVYDFYHDFSPWAGVSSKDQYDSSKGYTVIVKAVSFNNDEQQRFFFQPFSLISIVNDRYPTFSFEVNKSQWSRLKDNLASYEIQTKKDQESWVTYLSDIPVTSSSTNSSLTTVHDETNGKITVRSLSKQLPAGQYEVRVVAVDKWGYRQESQAIVFNPTGFSSYKPNLPIASGWFPLQINTITGSAWRILSSFATSNPESISTVTSMPTFKGIAFSRSTVTMLVTDVKNAANQRRYYTTVNTDSTWSLTPSIYPSSIIDLWVLDDQGRYNEIPTFILNKYSIREMEQ
jgi:hypothetical protein